MVMVVDNSCRSPFFNFPDRRFEQIEINIVQIKDNTILIYLKQKRIMIPNTELENGKIALIREIFDIKDIHDIDLVSEYSRELTSTLGMQEMYNDIEEDR